MAFVPTQRSRVLAGALNLTAYMRQWSEQNNIDMLDVTCVSDGSNADMNSKAFIPGQDTSTATFGGPLDVDTLTANAGQANLLAAWKSSADLPITLAPSGLTPLAECLMTQMNQSSYQVAATPSGTTDWTLSGQADGPTDYGTVLENLTAVTVDGNGTARDGGAATSNGGVAHIHVSAFSGLTNNAARIEHSVDGSTSWATLVTFATYTAIGSERVVVAPATTVRRYLRVVDDVTGTGSTTRAVAFARR